MSDLISREAAKNEMSRFAGYLDKDMILRLQIALGKLKPAVVAENATGDNISKSEIMNALHERFPYGFETDAWWNSTVVLAAINQANPAEQRTGHWDKDGKCDQCREESGFSAYGFRAFSPYCPHCGVRMIERESENETDNRKEEV